MRALIIALLLAAMPALAQESDPPEPPANETPADAEEPGLDDLFADLAASGEEEADWKPIQNRLIRELSRSGSDTGDLLLSRGRKAISRGAYEEAAAHLSRLVAFVPDFAEGWNTRATVYYLMDDYGRSLADIRRTLALEPRHFGALSGMGMILERIGREQTAIRVFRRALEVHPHMPGAKTALERLEKKFGGRDI